MSHQVQWIPVWMLILQALVTTCNINGVVTAEVFVKDLKLLVQGDPREPDIFKINSTQLFFK